MNRFIAPNPAVPRYFSYEDGRTYLSIGQNLCFVRHSEQYTEEEVFALFHRWMRRLAENGGNFARVWLGTPFFDVMPERPGEFSAENRAHALKIVEFAEELGLKLKFTLEHFRRVAPSTGRDVEQFPGAVNFNKPLYSGLADSMRDYLASDRCRELYLAKAQFLAEAGIGDSPAVIAWELWNEINCIGSIDEIRAWSDFMLPRLRKMFPHQMVVQNLGSFSGDETFRWYDYLAEQPGNDFLQVHRYLDPGAALDVCRGSVDQLAADSIRELLDRDAGRPAILAEVGAVEANHSSYSHLYELDREGTLLHDQLFAPFFAGSAGSGQSWHWDELYIDRHDLWYHFRRFARAVEGIDPVAEAFRPFHTETHRLRLWGLRGKSHLLLWCRDKTSNWQSELQRNIPAEVISGESIPVPENAMEGSCYLPWEDRWRELRCRAGRGELPPFRRSIVVKIPLVTA